MIAGEPGIAVHQPSSTRSAPRSRPRLPAFGVRQVIVRMLRCNRLREPGSPRMLAGTLRLLTDSLRCSCPPLYGLRSEVRLAYAPLAPALVVAQFFLEP